MSDGLMSLPNVPCLVTNEGKALCAAPFIA